MEKIYHVDAFTDRPFAGNPAAVCILSGPHEESRMQQIAQEMNLSETAFVSRHEDGFNLRWFTPAVEIDLCGHATLASAHILLEEGYLKEGQPARFHTRSGLLGAIQRGDWIELDFPAEPEEPANPPPELLNALGVTPEYTGRNRFDYLVQVDSEETLRSIKPDFALLKEVPKRGVIVTAHSNSDKFDFVSRFFAPRAGINEDPVTGSAHCCLGPFWKKSLGKNEFAAYQASSRGGIVHVRLSGNRVILGGQAVTVTRGEIIGFEKME